MLPIFKLIAPHLQKVPLVFSPFGCVVCVFMIAYAAKAIHVALSVLLCGKYDAVQASFRTSGGSKGTWKEKTAARAFAAHMNSLEAFVGFSVAVIMAFIAGVKSDEFVQLCNAFVLVRCAYVLIYVVAFNFPLSVLRSSVFAVGFAITLQIMTLGAGDLKYTGM
mmetsp:Transcript_19811/g.28491  ORF Transcript_19811/g.28491 Transcript_19811/m.28491 type:complete len:164 (-) Transcript_19811:115-606(-)